MDRKEHEIVITRVRMPDDYAPFCLSENDNTIEEMETWRDQMQSNKPVLGGEGFVTISYVGMVTGPRQTLR
jgi:hypothetical protein